MLPLGPHEARPASTQWQQRPCSWRRRKLMAQNFITPKHTNFHIMRSRDSAAPAPGAGAAAMLRTIDRGS
jgi:hypothetical protein